MKQFICILACLLFSSSLVASTMEITVPKNASSFEVTLNSNPTTGYQWTVGKYDKSLFELASSKYVKPKKMMPGAGGTMVFTFKVLKNENSSMAFHYARPWESGSGKQQKVEIIFE